MAAADSMRWSTERAHAWYSRQPWALGANFIPANAINQLEMWQAATFDPARIDLELGWAASLQMNTMRVFLHDLLWQQDAAGFLARIDTYLAIAERHGIRTLLVLFDSCWDPRPQLGAQRPPIPGVHNSGWVQGPGASALVDAGQHARLREYVQGVVGRFANDPRVWGWDVWNEPDNQGGGNGHYTPHEAPRKIEHVAALLPQVFGWVREMNPEQPLTSGLWGLADWSLGSTELNAVQRAQLEHSDIVSFHEYGWPERFAARIEQLRAYGRPLVCTEFMARSSGSTFDGDLPIAHREHVGMFCWGFVAGRSQTFFPWDSWAKPYVLQPPVVWFHDVLHEDGRPYREAEAALLRRLGGHNAKAGAA
jgi:Cellulase (glycosyl hydrolase family 5)